MSIGTNLSTDRGPLINLAEWITATGVILAFAGKIYTKWQMAKYLDLNDAFVGAATLMTIALCVSTAEQVKYGLGRNVDELSASQLSNFYLTTYLSELFYVWATFFAKLAGLHFLLTLALGGHSSRIVFGVLGFVGIWMIVAPLVLSFQCSLPHIWDLSQGASKCINEVAWWRFHGAIDILTQIPTAFLPVYLLWNVHTSGSTKLLIMLSFSPNILTVPFIILRLVYLKSLYSFTATNPTWNAFNLILVSCLHANFAIILGTIPFSKPIIDALSIGVITNDIGYSLRWDRVTAGVSSNKSGSKSNSGGKSYNPNSRAMHGWRKTSGGGTHSSSVVVGSNANEDEEGGMRMDDLKESGRQGDGAALRIREVRTTIIESHGVDEDITRS